MESFRCPSSLRVSTLTQGVDVTGVLRAFTQFILKWGGYLSTEERSEGGGMVAGVNPDRAHAGWVPTFRPRAPFSLPANITPRLFCIIMHFSLKRDAFGCSMLHRIAVKRVS